MSPCALLRALRRQAVARLGNVQHDWKGASTMAGKKKPSATRYKKQAQKRAKRQLANAKKRVQDYNRADRLTKQVSTTLKKIAATHPSPAGRKQAKLALRQLHDAHAAFGDACMCQGTDFGQDDT